MTVVSSRFQAILILSGLALLLIPVGNASAEELPCADEVMGRVVERAQRTPEEHGPESYGFHRNTTTEEFDSKGRARDRQEKIEEIIFHSGQFFRKKIRHEGRTVLEDKLGPDPGELVADEELTLEEIDLAGYRRYKRGDYVQFFTPELIARYDFKTEERIELNDRATLVISFSPKEKRLPAGQLIDRIFNEISGTLWIDEDDSEVARARFILGSQVYFFGGIAGVVRSGDITVERVRVGEGVWFNHLTNGDISGRKFLESKRVKITSISDQFHRLGAAEPERAEAGRDTCLEASVFGHSTH